MTDLARLDAVAQADLVRQGEATAGEVVEAALERIASVDPLVNAVVSTRDDRALADAERADGPFAGVPMLLKDGLAPMEGEPFDLGVRALAEAGYTAPRSSWLTERYIAAGFVVVGRSNMPELALLPDTAPDVHGPTRNPWDLDRSAGGSSGGAAAAVASGQVPVAHGSDMGGSIRLPSSWNGLVGLKPSRGRTTTGPDFGEYWGQMTHQHVLTRSVRDCAAVLDATAGPGSGDPYSAPQPERPWLAEVAADPGRLRIGVLAHRPQGGDVDPAVVAAVESTARTLAGLGHAVDDTWPERMADLSAGAAYGTMFFVHIASEIDRLGSVLGRDLVEGDVEDATWGLAQLGRGISGPDHVHAHRTMHAWSRAVAAWWDAGHDILVLPQVPFPALRSTEFADGGEKTLECVPFTLPFNITGQPAISLPLGTGDDGLPIGVQIVAAYGREDILFRVAGQLEQAVPWADRVAPVHA